MSVCAAIGLSAMAAGQSFNIDLNMVGGSPQLGAGTPADTFGAAAGQAGYWNGVGALVGFPIPLDDLQGNATGATVIKTADNPGGIGGFNFAGNTGDFALLLNDAEQVATLVDGGTMTYTFSGLLSGQYEVYTYAAHLAGLLSPTPVFVPEASHSNTQIVTGPMPGNAFQYLVTHSIHAVSISGGEGFRVSITQPPNHPQGMTINGFQIVAVPEPGSASVLAFGIAILLCRQTQTRHRPVRREK